MTMNFWEFVLLCSAAYVAIVTLVRMMRRKENELIDELTQEAEAKKQLLRDEEKNEKRRKIREKIEQEEAESARAA